MKHLLLISVVPILLFGSGLGARKKVQVRMRALKFECGHDIEVSTDLVCSMILLPTGGANLTFGSTVYKPTNTIWVKKKYVFVVTRSQKQSLLFIHSYTCKPSRRRAEMTTFQRLCPPKWSFAIFLPAAARATVFSPDLCLRPKKSLPGGFIHVPIRALWW
jgi:hypothetical protein